MSQRRLPIMPTLVAAYRDLGRLLTAMRALMLSAFFIMLATSVAAELVPQRLWDQELTGEALGLAQNAIEAFLLTPIIIAIHRFVILDEITPNYMVPIGEPVFGIFFAWLLALKVLIGLPFWPRRSLGIVGRRAVRLRLRARRNAARRSAAAARRAPRHRDLPRHGAVDLR